MKNEEHIWEKNKDVRLQIDSDYIPDQLAATAIIPQSKED